ncbi:MAG: outer membrane beta-barrel protein [Bacteroidetes bacterium]|jgi:hypothetical protein|nr:outer membrane beta-barrel protein [Bacteroidota bacterium]
MPHALSRVFFVVLLTFSAHAVSAQLKIGAGIGAQSSNLMLSEPPASLDLAGTRSMLGAHAMLVGRYDFSDRFSVRSGLGFQRHRVSWIIDPVMNPEVFVFTMDYLNVPLVAQFVPIERWHVTAGMETRFLLAGPEEAERWNRLDFGLLVGAGFDILPELVFKFEYFAGLPVVGRTSVLNEDSGDEVTYNYLNRSLQVSCIYYFCE